MPKIKRPRREPTEDWQQLQLLCESNPQMEYELIRPVVLFGQTATERARQSGKSEATIRRRVEKFMSQGMQALFTSELINVLDTSENPTASKDTRFSFASQRLPTPIQNFILELVAQYAHFSPNDIAHICHVQFGRRPDPRTVQRVLAKKPLATLVTPRFPAYAEIEDSVERRVAIVRLHSEGWKNSHIAAYLHTTRRTVYSTLKHWWEEGVKGLEDKSHARKDGVRKVTFNQMQTVLELQQNPNLGKIRMQAALKQLGIELSPASCARVMARNRELYSLEDKPQSKPRVKKKMPFLAEWRHQYWSVDVRYIPEHQLGGGYIYVITILENYSRAILASVVTRTQDLKAYLMVLYAAVKMHGCPEVLVSDSGAIFLARAAQEIYSALGIEKKQIARRQPWQNLIETHFSVQHRMADYHFAAATTWQELVAAHEQWTVDYNYQEHWAHRERNDNRRSPAAVLSWVRGKSTEGLDLERTFQALRNQRRVNKLGYVRFRHWQIYGELGLAKHDTAIWLYGETLSIEFKQQPLSEYSVKYESGQKKKFRLLEITPVRLYDSAYKSPQLYLWPKGEVEWRLVWPVAANARSTVTKTGAESTNIMQLLLFEPAAPFSSIDGTVSAG